MATRTTVTLVDDLDGGTAEETVGFGLDGAVYEIDLSAANAGELRAALERYVAAARRTGGRRATGNGVTAPAAPSPSSSAPSSSSRERNQEIRAWANEHGAGLSSRGRLPGWVVEAFDAGDPSLLTRTDESARTEPAGPAEPVEPTEPVEPAEPDSAAEEPRGRDGLTADERERIRAWAIDEGIEVKARGQLKKDLIANYQATATRQG
ncbi:Lsr2 dimerization domain-containing protein [Actinomycetospora chiangmaiensis]|uniref:Lsr2 dimerization domain-containing protein n=1 Tax=Actinomycetospora chiangmaiensis TaxID=402650 RepID=UPI00037F3044